MRKLKKFKKVVKRFFTILGVLILVVILSFLYAYRPQSFDDITNNMMDEVAYVVCSDPEYIDIDSELEELKNTSYTRIYGIINGGAYPFKMYYYNSDDELLFKTTRIGYSVQVTINNKIKNYEFIL